MDSEDSRDASSGNESDDKGHRSPTSSRSRSGESNMRSSRSRSRSSSPLSRHQSASPKSRPQSPDSGPQSPQNGIRSRRSSEVQSPLSRSSSSDDDGSRSRSRPHTPKSPESISFQSGCQKSQTHSPGSPSSQHRSRSSRSASPTQNNVRIHTPRSPSSRNSVHNSSPDSLIKVIGKSPIADDNVSTKSDSSHSSKKSRSSRGSGRSSSSRGSRRSREKSNNGNSSDSSESSVDSSSRKNKNISKIADTQPEEISDGDIGDMESDHGKDENIQAKDHAPKPEVNISHEDLSDVSDLEDSIGDNSDDDHLENKEENKRNDLEATENERKSPEIKKVAEKNNRAEGEEEQLDFEAEDGECAEIEPTKEQDDTETDKIVSKNEVEKSEDKQKVKEELEEGEVTDEDDARPEETEPRPVCRFFSRGQCTWGASCRFLHPGVTDKGNYTMFDLIRPVVPGEFGRDERIYGKAEPPLVESAWERGLRTAKEMLRKSVKRKEQDIDFEEKKMNLSLAQEEFDKENGYYGRVPSPEPRYVRHVPVEYPVARAAPEEYYGRRQVLYEPDYVPPPRERIRSYRELPPHRMPDYYNNKYEEEQQTSTKRNRPKREVIVQRVEERQGRGDEWSDPWMRSKSPGRRKEGGGGRKRSYSSGSTYSSSSSSRTSSESSQSSYRSRSRSSHRRRRSRSRRSRQISPSVIVSERKAANERAALMNPPAPKRRAPSPGMMRVSGAANPPAPSREDQFGRNRSKLAVAAALARVKGRRRSSRSSSGSSGSSSSDSDSSDSSTSTSRDGSSPPRRATGVDLSIAKAMDALKGGSSEKKQIKLNLKNPVGVRKSDLADLARKTDPLQAKKRGANSPPLSDSKSKKATSRREELLKQLKAVEDAIAKKRSKVN